MLVREDPKPGVIRRGLQSLAGRLVRNGYYKIDRAELLNLVHDSAYFYEFDATKAFYPGPGGAGYVGEIPEKAVYPYQLLDTHYQTNPWVNRCVTVIANSVAALPLGLYKETISKGKPKRSPVLKHDALALMNRPNPLTTGRDYKREMASESVMYGEVWQYTDDGTEGKGGKPGKPKELRLFKSQHIAPIPGKLKLIDGYEYMHNSEAIKIAPHYIAATRIWNPQNSYRGLPPMQVARESSLLQYYMRRHNRRVFENGTFFGLYMHTDAPLTKDVADTIAEHIKKEYSGVNNPKKFPILYGGFDIKNATTNAIDGDFINIGKYGREETLVVFGVPPVAVGVLDYANYANTWQQMKMFYELTIMPLCEMLADMLNAWLRTFWPDETDLYWQFDYSGIKFLGEEAESADRIASAQVRDGRMTINEWRASVDLPPVEWGDEPPPSLSGLFGLSGVSSAGVSEKTLWIKKGSDYETRRARWAAADKRVQADVPLYSKLMLAHWEDQKQRILSKLRGYSASATKSKGKDIAKALPTAEDLFDSDYEARQLAKAARPLIARVVERAGKQRLVDIGSSVEFNVTDTRVEAFVQNKTFRMSRDVTLFTQKAIREIIVDAVVNQLDINQIASRITETFEDFERYRALRVARTESVGAHNGAAIEAYDQGGVEKKGWAAIIDDATRDSHVEMDGVEVPLRDDFPNGLSAPGVPGATAGPDVVGELVNCRCTIYAA